LITEVIFFPKLHNDRLGSKSFGRWFLRSIDNLRFRKSRHLPGLCFHYSAKILPYSVETDDLISQLNHDTAATFLI